AHAPFLSRHLEAFPMQRETRKPGPNRASASHLRLVEADSARSAPTLPTRARDRIVIVPLDTPPPAQFRPMGDAQLAREADVPSLAPPLPPTVDRRQQWPGRPEDRDPLARLACPKCGTRARIDHVD